MVTKELQATGYVGTLSRNESINKLYKEQYQVFAYKMDYELLPVPVSRAIGYELYTKDEYPEPTREELGGLYNDGWQVFIDGSWRGKMSDRSQFIR